MKLSEDQIKYFQQQIKKGAPAGEIRNELTSMGCDEESIQAVFAFKTHSKSDWLMQLGIFVSLLGLALVFFDKKTPDIAAGEWNKLLFLGPGLILAGLVKKNTTKK
jgi:hypothetical protein